MVFYQFYFAEVIRLNFILLAAGLNSVGLFTKYLVSYNFPVLFMKSIRPWRPIFEPAKSAQSFFLAVECHAVLTLSIGCITSGAKFSFASVLYLLVQGE